MLFVNNRLYGGFRASNKEAVRTTLSDEEIVSEVTALEDNSQKRLILVYGEHPKYSAEYIAHTARVWYMRQSTAMARLWKTTPIRPQKKKVGL